MGGNALLIEGIDTIAMVQMKSPGSFFNKPQRTQWTFRVGMHSAGLNM